jgi:hypothetical protein
MLCGLILVFPLETGSHYEAQTGLELVIPLPQPPECWGDRPAMHFS